MPSEASAQPGHTAPLSCGALPSIATKLDNGRILTLCIDKATGGVSVPVAPEPRLDTVTIAGRDYQKVDAFDPRKRFVMTR